MRYAWLYAIVLAAVIGGFLWLAENARAADAPAVVCHKFTELVAKVRPREFVRAIIGPIEGSQAQNFIAAFNKLPPVSHVTGDTVMIAVFADGRGGIAIIVKGCVVDQGLVAGPQLTKLLEGLPGGLAI
jgi:hypothetical protein